MRQILIKLIFVVLKTHICNIRLLLVSLFFTFLRHHFSSKQGRTPKSSTSTADTRTQLKGPKGDGDMQAARRHCNAPPIRYLNIWLCGRQTDLSGMGFRMGVFGSIDRY